jgi:hypothetical protein
MLALAFLDKLPRPVVFGLYGTVAGLLAALTAGELVWYLLRPPPPPDAEVRSPALKVPSTPAKFAITVSPKVSVYPGGTNFVTVRVARERSDGFVTIKFSAAVELTVAEITIPAGETTAQVQIAAALNAKPGVYKLAVIATAASDDSSQTASLEITVLPLPPPPSRLAVSISPKVQAYQRGKNTFAVRIARGEFDGDVAVTFDGLPAGVTIPEVVIPAGRAEATAELTAEGSTKTGPHTITATARAAGKESVAAVTEAALEVLGSPKLSVDVVFVLDCTGSMKKAVAGIDVSLAKFRSELVKAQLDARFGLVGFQDRTLGQMLQVPLFDGEPFTTDIAQLRIAISELKLGGGGGEGDSSLDGIARAADCPFRESVPRIVLLITDGGPKKVDWRIKSMEEMVKYLKEKKIDQLHVATTPEHRKAFEPVWEGAKGQYLDLAAANMSGDYDKLMTDFGNAMWKSLPERPENKPVASGLAQVPVLPPVVSVKPPALPPGAEPDEPNIEKLVVAPEAAPEAPSMPQVSKSRFTFASVMWAFTVVVLVSGAMFLGQKTFLSGEVPSLGVGLAIYGVGIAAGLVVGVIGYSAVAVIDSPVLARLAGGCGVGFGVGLLVSLEQMLRQETAPSQSKLTLDPPAKPIGLDEEPKLPAPAPVLVKPVITAPKPRDGCPGCGRVIPGELGKRYCMVCDNTF